MYITKLFKYFFHYCYEGKVKKHNFPYHLPGEAQFSWWTIGALQRKHPTQLTGLSEIPQS